MNKEQDTQKESNMEEINTLNDTDKEALTEEEIQEEEMTEEERQEQEAMTKTILEEIEKQKKQSTINFDAKKDEVIDMENERLRMFADMENFKKRVSREQIEQTKYLTEKIISSLIPVLDNLSLALQYGKNIPEAKDFYVGVEMTHKLLLEELSSYGFSEVGKVGDEFSPTLHEAVGVDENNTFAPNTIAQLLQVGYVLNGRTLRPAKVLISKAQ